MRAYASLRRRADFARVHRRGRRKASTFLVCIAAEGRERTRVGFAIGTEIGGAVVRNRLRRRIKAILDGYPLAAAPFRDVLFIARPGAGELAFAEVAAEVERTFGPRP